MRPGDSVTHDGFQSTRPVKGATYVLPFSNIVLTFQSTRPVKGATCSLESCQPPAHCFNPRAP